MSSTDIESVFARRVWDSRGRPTVEAEVHLQRRSLRSGHRAGGRFHRHARGAGAARRRAGLRRAGRATRAAACHHEIAAALRGSDAADQAALDQRLIELDGTAAKSRLGANATLAVSMAGAHAAAAAAGLPLYRWLGGDTAMLLPLPQIQIFGGGAHAERCVDIQDFMAMCPGAEASPRRWKGRPRFSEPARPGCRCKGAARSHGAASEGGWWPDFDSNEQALQTLLQAIEAVGFVPGEQVAIALDVAASEFGRGGRYRLGLEQRELDSDGLAEMSLRWIRALSDRFDRRPAGRRRPGRLRALHPGGGPPLGGGRRPPVSSAAMVQQAAAAGAANCVLLKPNQRGTLSETLDAWHAACRRLDMAGSCRHVRARPKTPPSCTWPSAGA